ncbi:MAG: 2-oxoacid:acceptor oxidoreductase family protein [Clostridia bacterium]
MEYRIVCSGFGGQGVLSLGKFIIYSAIDKGLESTWLPSYGPEMRGGTANCSLVIADDEVASPLVNTPDCVIAMNRPSLDKFENAIVPGGMMIVNSSLIDVKVQRKDISAIYVDATEISHKLGNDRSANIVMLGAFIKATNILDKETVIKMLSNKFGSKKDSVIAIFNAGYEAK